MTNGNDNAYPVISFDHEGRSCEYESGLTKREYFAAMAMQGMVSKDISLLLPKEIASDAVMFADALIKELNKT